MRHERWYKLDMIICILYCERKNMIGMRMNAFNDTGLGEPEQDANTALIELDKGLLLFF